MIHGQYGARRLGEPINNVAIRRKAFAEPALQQSPSTSNATECPDKGGNADLLVLDVSFGAKADEKSPPRMLLFNPDLTAIRQCTLQSVKKHKRQSRQGRTASSPTSQSPVLLTDYSEPLARQINIAAEKTSMFSVLSTSDAEWAEFHRACLSYELCSTTTRRDASCGDTVDALDVVYERLQEEHRGLSGMSQAWHWPVCNDRSITTEETLVPDVSREYEFPSADPSTETNATANANAIHNIVLQLLYASFVRWTSSIVPTSNKRPGSGHNAVQNTPRVAKTRLPVFSKLSVKAGNGFREETLEELSKEFHLLPQMPWEGLFDERDVKQWKDVISHYSTNNCNLFDDVVPITPSPMHFAAAAASPMSSFAQAQHSTQHFPPDYRRQRLPSSPPSFSRTREKIPFGDQKNESRRSRCSSLTNDNEMYSSVQHEF